MKVRTLLVAAVAVREVFSFWTGHPYDFELWVRTGYWVARGVNPYGIINPAPGLSFVSNISAGGNPTIAYLPFWPLLLAGIYELYALLGSVSPYFYYFLLKQPIIASDVLVGFFLYKYLDARSSDKARFVLKIWLFSPFNIILSGIWGMFDSVAALFVVFALTARPGAYRGAWEGIATFAKSIPLIYTIPVSLGPKPLRNLALAVGIPVVATVAVVWLEGWSFSVLNTTLESTLGKGGLSLSVWEVVFYLNSLGVVSNSLTNQLVSTDYVWIAAVAVATVVSYRWFGFDTERGVVQSMVLITLVFLLLRGQVNEQYAVYLYALMLIDVAMWSPQRSNLFFASLAIVILVTVTNDLLLIRFLAPVYPGALTLEGSLISKIAPERNAALFLEAMAFCAINVYYVYALAKERHSRTPDPLVVR